MMSKKFEETFEVRVMPGYAGLDPEASEWEVLEVRGEVAETACDNMTLAEANHIAEMWTKKRDEAEAEASQLSDNS
jgi:hypothetical protein